MHPSLKRETTCLVTSTTFWILSKADIHPPNQGIFFIQLHVQQSIQQHPRYITKSITQNWRKKRSCQAQGKQKRTQVNKPGQISLSALYVTMACHYEHSSLSDTSRQSLSRKRDPIPPKNHYKMRAKPLYPHQQHWTKMDNNRTALARHLHKSACQ